MEPGDGMEALIDDIIDRVYYGGQYVRGMDQDLLWEVGLDLLYVVQWLWGRAKVRAYKGEAVEETFTNSGFPWKPEFALAMETVAPLRELFIIEGDFARFRDDVPEARRRALEQYVLLRKPPPVIKT